VWSRQQEMLEAPLVSSRIAIRAGRKVSKSMSLVIMALWWSMARRGKVFMTSTSFPQVKGILWSELRDVVNRSGLPLKVPLDPMTGILTPGGGMIVGRTADVRENMQGFSGANALYLVDEASGVSRQIMEAIDGNTAGGGVIVMAANPTRLSGTFYDAFHSAKDQWTGIRISSRETPNVQQGQMLIPGLATREWIDSQDQKHGADGAYVRVHVDGEFPTGGEDSVIPLSLVDAAQSVGSVVVPDGPLCIGIDVARMGGDETIVVARRGRVVYPVLTSKMTDTYDCISLILKSIERHWDADARVHGLPQVNVDVIGVGAGVYDVLSADENYNSKLDAIPINVAERSTEPETYRLLRDELWFKVKEWLNSGGCLPKDDSLREDLIAATYKFDSKGRYVVSSKDELRESLGRSPDRADALALSIFSQRHSGFRVRSL